MLRAILEPAAFFLIPFILYALWLTLVRRALPVRSDWAPRPVSWLTLAGLGLAVLGIVLGGLLAPRQHGAYVPAHIENGRLVPGGIR